MKYNVMVYEIKRMFQVSIDANNPIQAKVRAKELVKNGNATEIVVDPGQVVIQVFDRWFTPIGSASEFKILKRQENFDELLNQKEDQND